MWPIVIRCWIRNARTWPYLWRHPFFAMLFWNFSAFDNRASRVWFWSGKHGQNFALRPCIFLVFFQEFAPIFAPSCTQVFNVIVLKGPKGLSRPQETIAPWTLMICCLTIVSSQTLALFLSYWKISFSPHFARPFFLICIGFLFATE